MVEGEIVVWICVLDLEIEILEIEILEIEFLECFVCTLVDGRML